MSLTNEQKEAVRCDQDVMLTACPGSGKTRVIISKLSRAIDLVRETPRAVACITYTNTAVHEIDGVLFVNCARHKNNRNSAVSARTDEAERGHAVET